LMQNADHAMYNSKKDGRNTFSFHMAGTEGPS
jgi:GGDEF domain-containing protein